MKKPVSKELVFYLITMIRDEFRTQQVLTLSYLNTGFKIQFFTSLSGVLRDRSYNLNEASAKP